MLVGESGDPNFFLHISFSWVKIKLHTKIQLHRLPCSMSFLVSQEERRRRKKIRVKLTASLSPVGLVWVGAGLGLRLRLTNIVPDFEKVLHFQIFFLGLQVWKKCNYSNESNKF